MPLRRIAAGITLVVMLAACSGAAPTGLTPPAGTPAPGASGTPAPGVSGTPPAVTTPPATAPGTSQQPGASFTGDPVLAAKFPTLVGGKPFLGRVTTGLLVDLMRALNTPQAQVDTIRQGLATIGIDLNTVVFGDAMADVTRTGDQYGSTVEIEAFRVPGQDARKLIPNYALFLSHSEGDTLSQETVSGKNISVLRDPTGSSANHWMYANGDILWLVPGDQWKAEAVFTALP